MIVHQDPPPRKAGSEIPRPEAQDPRVAAFAGLTEAVDRSDSKVAVARVRELRVLGYSVVILAGAAGKGGR